jgi:hypothetical protein
METKQRLPVWSLTMLGVHEIQKTIRAHASCGATFDNFLSGFQSLAEIEWCTWYTQRAKPAETRAALPGGLSGSLVGHLDCVHPVHHVGDRPSKV